MQAASDSAAPSHTVSFVATDEGRPRGPANFLNCRLAQRICSLTAAGVSRGAGSIATAVAIPGMASSRLATMIATKIRPRAKSNLGRVQFGLDLTRGFLARGYIAVAGMLIVDDG